MPDGVFGGLPAFDLSPESGWGEGAERRDEMGPTMRYSRIRDRGTSAES
jgi:hypothetical protein